MNDMNMTRTKINLIDLVGAFKPIKDDKTVHNSVLHVFGAKPGGERKRGIINYRGVEIDDDWQTLREDDDVGNNCRRSRSER